MKKKIINPTEEKNVVIGSKLVDDSNKKIDMVEKFEKYTVNSSNKHTKNKINSFIQCIKGLSKETLVSERNKICNILVYLPICDFIETFKCLDNIDGIVFYYIMEARENKKENTYDEMMLNRLFLLNLLNLLHLALATMKKRLVGGLLEEDFFDNADNIYLNKDKQFFKEFTESLNINEFVQEEKVHLFQSLATNLIMCKHQKNINEQFKQIDLIDFYNNIDTFVNEQLVIEDNE